MVAGMARANRLRGDGGIFHLTHRCHNRAFLLKFARDRDAYRAKVREHVQQFDLAVLDYCLTSNHVHLLVDAPERLAVSGFMRDVASRKEDQRRRTKGSHLKIQQLAMAMGEVISRFEAAGLKSNELAEAAEM